MLNDLTHKALFLKLCCFGVEVATFVSSRLCLSFCLGLYTYPCTTRLEPAYIYSTTTCTLACPGIRSLFSSPLSSCWSPSLVRTYVPAMDGRPPCPFLSSPIPHRRQVDDFLLCPKSSLPRSFNPMVAHALLSHLLRSHPYPLQTRTPLAPLRLNNVATTSH